MMKRRRQANIPGHKSEAATAKELGVSLRTLRKWRQEGSGPPYIKFARAIHYPDEGRATWLRGQQITPVRSQQAA